MKTPNEITFLAFKRNDDGSLSLLDIIETSNYFASNWWRKLSRDEEVCSIEVCISPKRNGRRIELRGARS